MAFWSIIGKGAGEHAGKAFGVSLDTDKREWMASGASVDVFFKTKVGVFNVALIPENGTQLVDANSSEVAFFTALNGSSSVGDTGSGRASEKGTVFSWKIDSK